MSDFFLKFAKPTDGGKDINGSSQAVHHPGWVELMSFSWGLSSSNAVNGQSSLHEMHFMTADAAASMPIFLAVAVGTTYPTATVEAVSRDQTVLSITMTGVRVTQATTGSGRGEPVPTLQFTLNFEKVSFKYLKASAATPAPQPGAPARPAVKTK